MGQFSLMLAAAVRQQYDIIMSGKHKKNLQGPKLHPCAQVALFCWVFFTLRTLLSMYKV